MPLPLYSIEANFFFYWCGSPQLTVVLGDRLPLFDRLAFSRGLVRLVQWLHAHQLGECLLSFFRLCSCITCAKNWLCVCYISLTVCPSTRFMPLVSPLWHAVARFELFNACLCLTQQPRSGSSGKQLVQGLSFACAGYSRWAA